MAAISGNFANSTQMVQTMMPEPMPLIKRDKGTKEDATVAEAGALAEVMDKEEALEEANHTTTIRLTSKKIIIINNSLLQRTCHHKCILHQKTIYNAQVHCHHSLAETSTGPQGIIDYLKDLCWSTISSTTQ